MGDSRWSLQMSETVMSRKYIRFFFVILAATNLSIAASAGPPAPTLIVINAEHDNWVFTSTNLTLIFSNGVYAAGTYTVAPALVSNLMAVAKRPWPEPATKAWPRFTIDLANVGLTPAWVQTNYPRLLEAVCGDSEKGPFRNVSEQRRAWLTNALADIEVLGESLRAYLGMRSLENHPSLELRFEHDDGQIVEQVFRLSTRAQPRLMLPWKVCEGTNEFTSGNADISRAVARILPPGFMYRDWLNGDLVLMIRDGLSSVRKVGE
jgi:hypothetical protein